MEEMDARLWRPRPRLTDDIAVAAPWCNRLTKVSKKGRHLNESEGCGCPESRRQVNPGTKVGRYKQGGDHTHLGIGRVIFLDNDL